MIYTCTPSIIVNVIYCSLFYRGRAKRVQLSESGTLDVVRACFFGAVVALIKKRLNSKMADSAFPQLHARVASERDRTTTGPASAAERDPLRLVRERRAGLPSRRPIGCRERSMMECRGKQNSTDAIN